MTHEESVKLDKIYRLYEQPMYRIAYAVLGQQEAAEDAVSEAFIRIIKRLGRLGEPDSPKTKKYIVKVIRSTSINQYRKNKHFFTREQPLDEEMYQLPDMHTDVESEVFGRQPAEILSKLSDSERRLIELRCVEGLSWHDAARILSISEATARKRFERIKKRLISVKGEMENEKINASRK